ncbi:hypothetical protein HDU91_000806 [Kappamyces sp. JEL0680]|nr:hypothetical protein HDU91_000806 [Kappamyces sp. JEL0680]
MFLLQARKSRRFVCIVVLYVLSMLLWMQMLPLQNGQIDKLKDLELPEGLLPLVLVNEKTLAFKKAWLDFRLKGAAPVLVNRRDPTVAHDVCKMIFIHENLDLSLLQEYENIEYLNVHKLSLFISQRMCTYYNLLLDSPECFQLAKSFYYADDNVWGSAIAQYRVLFGYAMQEYIPPSYCRSWAYADHDMLFGNINSVIKDNDLYWSSDIVSISANFWGPWFAAGQWTSYIQTRNATFVNNLFSGCRIYDSWTSLDATMNNWNEYYAADEGCQAQAALRLGAVHTQISLQVAGEGDDVFVLWNQGYLSLFTEEDVILGNFDAIANEAPRHQPLNEFTATDYELEWVPKNNITEDTKCAGWIPLAHQACTRFEEFQELHQDVDLDFTHPILQLDKAGRAHILGAPQKDIQRHHFALKHFFMEKRTKINLDLFNDTMPVFVWDKRENLIQSFPSLDNVEEWMAMAIATKVMQRSSTSSEPQSTPTEFVSI